MKRIALITIILVISSCSINNQELNRILFYKIMEVEQLVNKYDEEIRIIFLTHDYEKINSLALETSLKIKQHKLEIENIREPQDGILLKNAAMNYIETLDYFVLNQGIYTYYSDSISEDLAISMDEKNMDAVRSIESSYQKLAEIQQSFRKQHKLE